MPPPVVEILVDPGAAPRGRLMIEAMIAAAPVPVVARTYYRGDCDLLMIYGTGHPIRRTSWLRHLKRGRHVVGWDLGYWKRKHDDTFRMRLTIDADHPHALIRPEDPQRWDAEQIPLRNDYNPKGPIVLVGLGRKTAKVLGIGNGQWERNTLRALQREFPGRRIVYRPKRITDSMLFGIPALHGSIEQVLQGASLVVCRHSNVAVDACIAGVPVRCEDGAALALYRDNPSPTPEQRMQFLRSLAHWQYQPEEAPLAWQYLLSRLPTLSV